MDRKENIRNAYRLTGSNNFYDGMVTCSTRLGQGRVPLGVGYGQGGVRRISE